MAWQKYKVRPPTNSKSPEKTNREFCIYNTAHRDYTYNDKSIEKLVVELGGPIVAPSATENVARGMKAWAALMMWLTRSRRHDQDTLLDRISQRLREPSFGLIRIDLEDRFSSTCTDIHRRI